MNDDLRGRLEQWASTDTPAPDAAFADRLEDDIRSQAYFAPEEGHGSRTPKARFRPAIVMAALVIFALGGWLVNRTDTGLFIEVAVAEASDTQLVLPDGSIEPAVEGKVLVNGTQIVIGPSGTAVVGGVVLMANERAQVSDGVVVIDSPVRATAPPTDRYPTATAVDTVRPTNSDVRPTAVPTAGPAATVDRPRVTARPIDKSIDRLTPEPSVIAAQAPTVNLSATKPQPSRVLLQWAVTGNDSAIAGWQVSGLIDDGERTLATLRDLEARELLISISDQPVSAFRVRARDPEGHLVAQSDLVATPD
jgi:hypothetical protein